MQLLDHVSIAVSDLRRSRAFYDAVMSALLADKVYDRADAIGYGARCRADNPLESYLAVYQSSEPMEPASRRHWCFKAQSRQKVRDFHAAALAHGGSCDGAPGLRSYHAHYFAAFVRDPDGNRLEAVCHVAEPA